MDSELREILVQVHKDLEDDALRKAVISAATARLPLPDFVERRILETVWEFLTQRLARLLDQ